jgi:capsule polysaccharide export protein KpsC/LpsZ
MRAPQYTDQATLAATIAKSLPLGWTLYVKEHPAFVGGYNLETLRRLSAIDNAKLVSPSLNARRLAADADAVVVINSKVGLESLYLDTPVVVLGDPFYSRKGLTADVSDLNELATIFRTLVNQKTTAADEEVLGKLLCRLRDQSYSGKVLRRSDKESQTTKNAQKYALAISDVLNSKGLLD